MSESSCRTALWMPGWYELDQTLVVGERQKFWFFESPPSASQTLGEPAEFVFFNQLDSTRNCVVRYARIQEMQHPQLGSLLRIDTDGLDYIFFPVAGEELVVNAEENPGSVYDSDLKVDNWSVFVLLTDISDPVAEATGSS